MSRTTIKTLLSNRVQKLARVSVAHISIQLHVHCPQVGDLKLAMVSTSSKHCQSGPFLLESWLLAAYQHTTAPRLTVDGFAGLTQTQLLLFILGEWFITWLRKSRGLFSQLECEGILRMAKKLQKKIFPISAFSIWSRKHNTPHIRSSGADAHWFAFIVESLSCLLLPYRAQINTFFPPFNYKRKSI